MGKVLLLLTVLLSLFLGYSFGNVLPEPLSTSQPTFASVRNPNLPSSNLWGDLKPPYPTNAFWTNLVLNNGTSRVNIIPYHIRANNEGLTISFPRRTVSERAILATFINDISMEMVETSASRRVSRYDLVSVTMEWGNGNLRIPLVRGNPYITGIYRQATPLFKTVHAILSVNGILRGRVQGSKFEVVMNSNQKWIIYSSQPITLDLSAKQLQSVSEFSGIIRIAISSGEAMEQILDRHQRIYPVGGNVSYSMTGQNEATIRIRWRTAGIFSPNDILLMAALPHHMDCLVNASVVMNDAYVSLRGSLTLISGNTWNMREQLTTIGWNSPTPVDPLKQTAIINALQQDQLLGFGAPDPYFFGKEIARNGRLALIADQLRRPDIANSVRSRMKTALNRWLLGENNNQLQYDTTWGGICSRVGLANSAADFGNGVYNDHHFHYGYHIYAAAVIAKEDEAWARDFSRRVNDLVRDYANPSTSDRFFPVTRNKDWYVGHSWASGITEFGDAKNQESTSEAINSYYAIYLWGLATRNETIANLGRVMLATEIRSTIKYWQIPSNSSIYPSPFSNTKVVGILWETKVDYATWFGLNVEFIHCIQMLPFTPISESHLPRRWIQEQYPILSTAFTRQQPALSDGWKGYILMAHAIFNPERAWLEAQTLRGYDGGNTRTNTLYWIATRPRS